MISFLLCLAILIVGYFVYGKIVDNTFGPDDRETPAVRINDGVDQSFLVAAPFLFCAYLHTKTARTTHRSGCGVKFLCRSRRFLRSWFLPVLNRSAPYFTVRAA